MVEIVHFKEIRMLLQQRFLPIVTSFYPERATNKLCCLDRGEGASPKDNLLHWPYLIKKTTRGWGGQKLPILRWYSLWTAPKVKAKLTILIPLYQPESVNCRYFQKINVSRSNRLMLIYHCHLSGLLQKWPLLQVCYEQYKNDARWACLAIFFYGS